MKSVIRRLYADSLRLKGERKKVFWRKTFFGDGLVTLVISFFAIRHFVPPQLHVNSDPNAYASYVDYAVWYEESFVRTNPLWPTLWVLFGLLAALWLIGVVHCFFTRDMWNAKWTDDFVVQKEGNDSYTHHPFWWQDRSPRLSLHWLLVPLHRMWEAWKCLRVNLANPQVIYDAIQHLERQVIEKKTAMVQVLDKLIQEAQGNQRTTDGLVRQIEARLKTTSTDAETSLRQLRLAEAQSCATKINAYLQSLQQRKSRAEKAIKPLVQKADSLKAEYQTALEIKVIGEVIGYVRDTDKELEALDIAMRDLEQTADQALEDLTEIEREQRASVPAQIEMGHSSLLQEEITVKTR